MTKDRPVIANLRPQGRLIPDDVATKQTSLAREGVQKSLIVTASPIGSSGTLFNRRAGRKARAQERHGLPPDGEGVDRDVGLACGKSPSHVEASLKPHTTESVNFTLSVPQPTETAELAPAVIKWSARYDVPGSYTYRGHGNRRHP